MYCCVKYGIQRVRMVMVVVESFVPLELWQKCMDILQGEVQLQQFNTWLRPLKIMADDDALCLLAPNRFVLDWVKDKFLARIQEIMDDLSEGNPPLIALGVAMQAPSFSGKKRQSRGTKARKPDESEKPKNRFKAFSQLANNPKQYMSRFSSKYASGEFESSKDEGKYSSEQEILDLDGEISPHMDNRSNNSDALTLLGKSNKLQQPKTGRSKVNLTQKNSLDFSRLHNSLNSKFISSESAPLREKSSNKNHILRKKNKEIVESSNTLSRPVLSNFAPTLSKDSSDSYFTITGRKKAQEPSSLPLCRQVDVEGRIYHKSALYQNFTFETFVEGKSNQLALAAAKQIIENPGAAYNPLFLYGGVGLGKTHLMHAVGNHLMQRNNDINVVYLHSERFVADMVKALQLNAINDFKRYYRSVDVLLIDDIQFFSGKDRSQEEFFHTFNALLEGGQQVILTCDRYPKEIGGLEERLKSRFGWGLTVSVEPPELETRVAILMKKAEQAHVDLPSDAAFFIAKRLRSNVRELEGALKRVIASAHFMGVPIDTNLIKEALKDLLALQDKLISIDNIKKTVSEYYKIKLSDILSKTRARAVARPRQIAMALAKELTSHSLPEIGEAHGGRDHTTVLYACRKVKELISKDSEVANDYQQLLKSLTN